MSHLRRFMLLSCIVLTFALWGWACWRPDVHTSLEAWPIWLWSGWCLINALMSSQAQGRRVLLSAALLLLGSTHALQAWHVLMPYEDWLVAGMPDKPSLPALPAMLMAQGHRFVSLQWLPGCSSLPWYTWLLGAPFCLATQFVNGNHPVMPAWARVVAKFAIVCWLFTLMMWGGAFLVGTMKDAPVLFWGLLVVLLPFQLKSAPLWLLLPAWLASLAGLLTSSLRHLIDPTLIRDASFALAISLTALNWLVWWVRMDAMLRFDSVLAGLRELLPDPDDKTPATNQAETPSVDPAPDTRFDLISHLDSPQAQEGADKYTRE